MTSRPAPRRVLLADDDPAVLALLAEVLGREPDLLVQQVCADGHEAALASGRLQPDVAVVDVAMPGGGPLGVARLLALSPRTRVVVFTADGSRSGRDAMQQAGVVAHVLKSSPVEQVLAAVRATA